MTNLILLSRASLFYVGLGLLTLTCAPVAVACVAFPYAKRYRIVSAWARLSLLWLRISCNLKHSFEGLDNVPHEAAIVLCKHQSAWETLALNLIFKPQVWVLKRELLNIPVFGWGLSALQPIAIDRSARMSAVQQVIKQGRDRLNDGCWVVVFPEGTRVAAGQRKRYRLGGALLAEHTGRPVVPVAHDAGDYWPRRGFIKKPGTIRLVIGAPIDTDGMKASQINELAERWIESTLERIRREAGNIDCT